MAIQQESFVLNEFGLTERRRTTSRGTKSRFTVTIDAQPILHNYSEASLGGGVADEIRALLTNKIKRVTGDIAGTTWEFRRYAQAALSRGRRWAVKRYGGGRTGIKPPNQTQNLFHDSGRLAEGIFVRQNPVEKSWTVNVPANRLDPSTFRTRADYLAMVKRLQSAVPELGNARALVANPAVRRAIDDSLADLIRIGSMRRAANRAKLARDILALRRALAAFA